MPGETWIMSPDRAAGRASHTALADDESAAAAAAADVVLPAAHGRRPAARVLLHNHPGNRAAAVDLTVLLLHHDRGGLVGDGGDGVAAHLDAVQAGRSHDDLGDGH